MQPDENSKDNNWSFRVEGENEAPSMPDTGTNTTPLETITWTGSEFLHQHKGAGWYGALFVVIALIAAITFYISKDWLSAVFIVIVGVLFAIIASRKPRELHYIIDQKGLTVGQKLYRFNEFKSFSLKRDGAIGYIQLMPLGRLQPEVSVYYAPEDEQKIFDALSKMMPIDEHKDNWVDRFTKKIRF